MATFKTRQDYYQKFRDIGKNLGLTGTTLEILSQLLAEAEFESEVEHIAFSNESTLSRATQYNSKIQLCMDRMYSVYRGQCPRVYLKFISQTYLNLQPLDKVYSNNALSLYYLGYEEIDPDTGEESGVEIYAPVVIPPADKQYKIICLLASEKTDKELTLNSNTSVSQPGKVQYIDWPESNLTNDVWIQIANPGDSFKNVQVTRIFPDHVKDTSILFDLTIPDFGLRLFGDFIENMQVKMTAFKYCAIDSFNSSDLKNIKIPGTIPVDMTGDQDYTGVKINPESPRDTLKSIHYKANKEKYNSSILRSNSDLGLLLQEDFPNKIKSATYIFSGPSSAKIIETKKVSSFLAGTRTDMITNNQEPVEIPGVTGSSEEDLLTVSGYWGCQCLQDSAQTESGDRRYTYSVSLIENNSSKPTFSSGLTKVAKKSIRQSIYNTLKIDLPKNTTGLLTIYLSGQMQGRSSLSETQVDEIDYSVVAPFQIEKTDPLQDSYYLVAPSTATLARVYQIVYEYTETKVIDSLADQGINKSDYLSSLDLYYIPTHPNQYLTSQEISEFISSRRSYYITNDIRVNPGVKYRLELNISLELYQSISSDEISKIKTQIDTNILSEYTDKFGVDPEASKDDIIALISKIYGIKKVKSLQFVYYSSTGKDFTREEVLATELPYYFSITSYINTVLC